MKRKRVLLNTLAYSIAPVLITIAQYCANVLVLSVANYDIYVSPIELLLYEGVLFTIAGALTLIGIGGSGTKEAAEIAAVAKTFPSGDEAVGPSEIFREYIWEPKGSTRVGLILIFTGMLMVLAYLFTFFNT